VFRDLLQFFPIYARISQSSNRVWYSPERGVFVGRDPLGTQIIKHMHRFKNFVAIVITVGTLMVPGIIKADVTSSATQTQATFTIAQPTSTVLYMRVTAYSSTPDQTDSTPFITASGKEVADGIIASNLFPFGTKVQIPAFFGNKIFTVEDRMSKRIKNTIDIWMPTRAKAIVFGARAADIVVLDATAKLATAITLR